MIRKLKCLFIYFVYVVVCLNMSSSKNSCEVLKLVRVKIDGVFLIEEPLNRNISDVTLRRVTQYIFRAEYYSIASYPQNFLCNTFILTCGERHCESEVSCLGKQAYNHVQSLITQAKLRSVTRTNSCFSLPLNCCKKKQTNGKKRTIQSWWWPRKWLNKCFR